MKRCISLGLALALLLLCAAGTALADLKRGSKGEDVRAMQQQLIDIGVLEGEADGIFGRKTEKAVKAIQAMFGFKQTKRADEDFLNELQHLWEAVTGAETEPGAPMDDLPQAKPVCVPDGEAADGVDYCWRHGSVVYVKSYLDYKNVPKAVQLALWTRINRMYYDWIEGLFDDWAGGKTGCRASEAGEARAEFEAVWDEVAPDLAEANGPGTVKALSAQGDWLKNYMVDLCVKLYGTADSAE